MIFNSSSVDPIAMVFIKCKLLFVSFFIISDGLVDNGFYFLKGLESIPGCKLLFHFSAYLAFNDILELTV